MDEDDGGCPFEEADVDASSFVVVAAADLDALVCRGGWATAAILSVIVVLTEWIRRDDYKKKARGVYRIEDEG